MGTSIIKLPPDMPGEIVQALPQLVSDRYPWYNEKHAETFVEHLEALQLAYHLEIMQPLDPVGEVVTSGRQGKQW
ncbi:MAG: hypothetical protein M3380_11960 [Chloroflexota bacterium]|nr:hypothetical protein [Chloroflexota bacterium]